MPIIKLLILLAVLFVAWSCVFYVFVNYGVLASVVCIAAFVAIGTKVSIYLVSKTQSPEGADDLIIVSD